MAEKKEKAEKPAKRKSLKTKAKPRIEAKRSYVGDTEGKFLLGWPYFMPPTDRPETDSKTGRKIGNSHLLGVITGRMLVDVDGVACVVNTNDDVRFEEGEMTPQEIADALKEVGSSISSHYKKGSVVAVKVFEWSDTGRREYKEIAD
jgi:hypothetical protein